MTTAAHRIEELILQTDASGAPVRLEYVRGHTRWEASPSSRHQKMLQRIERSVRPSFDGETGCSCSTLVDVLIRFPDPDGSSNDPISPSFARSRRTVTKLWRSFRLQWLRFSALDTRTKTWDRMERRSIWRTALLMLS